MKAIWSMLAIVLAINTGALFASPAQAASVQSNLNISNALGTNSTGVDFAFVTVSDGVDGDIDFRVEINPALTLFGNGGPQWDGIKRFSFNFGGSDAITADNLVLPDGWSFAGNNRRQANFGRFDVKIRGTVNGGLDPLLFSIQGIDGDTPTDYASQLSRGGRLDSLFAAHIPGLYVTDRRGAHFGGSSVVPVPAAVWLMLSALGLLGIRARAKGSRLTANNVDQDYGKGFAGMGMLPRGWQASDGF